MRILQLIPIALISLLLFSACGGGSEASGEDPAPFELRKELMSVQEKLNRFAQEYDLTENEMVQKAEKSFMEAMQEFHEIRRSHPDLAPLFEKAEALKEKSIQERISGNEETFDELMHQYAEVRAKLEAKANQLPDIQEAKEQLKQAERAATEAMAEAAASINSKGREIAQELKSLLDEME